MDISISTLIVIITVVTSLVAWQTPTLTAKWIMNPYLVYRNNQYHRLLTSGFLHADYLHLAFNMIALYSFGNNVEYIFAALGRLPGVGIITPGNYQYMFILFYFLGVIISSLPSYFKHKNNPAYNALGASGGVSAILLASVLYNPLGTVLIYFIPMPGVILAIGYIYYSYVMSKRANDNIGHDAHLWGALYGIVFTIAINPSVVALFFSEIINGIGL